MTWKEFVKESIDKIKESQKPENIKERLRNEIEIQKLMTEKEKLRCETDSLKHQRLEKKYGGWLK